MHSLAPSESGSVVLELGPRVGVLIVHCGQSDLHREIEISPLYGDAPHGDAPRTHSAVRERRVADGVVYAALYPDLTPGQYTVHADPPGTVVIEGGGITEYHLI
jgi:hypothetical protein